MSIREKLFLSIFFSLIITYFTTGLLTLKLNHFDVKSLFEYASIDLTYQLFLQNYTLFYKALGMSLAGSFFFTLSIAFFPKKETIHGKARFAGGDDIKNKMNLYQDSGIIVGMIGKKLLRYAGKQFVSVAAGTRSGKGASLLVPNLLDCEDSCVVMDVKVENFMITSKYRKYILEQEVYLFNPFSYETHRYNPLDYINMNDITNRDLALNDIGNILYPQKGDSTTKFFQGKARNLFIGVCYLCNDILQSEKTMKMINEQNNDLDLNFSLPSILDIAQNLSLSYDDDGETEILSDFDEIVEYLKYEEVISSRTIQKLNAYMSTKAENTKSGIWSTFISPLEEFFDIDVTRAATKTSDFDLREVRKKKMTIYVGIPSDHLNKCELILNIFWSQLINQNLSEFPSENTELKHSCLLLMDEFSSMGYMDVLAKTITLIAGYDLRLVIAYHNNAQLEKPIAEGGYGKEGAKNILSNIPCKIYFAQELNEDAKALSETMGYKTVKQKSRNRNSGRGVLEHGTTGGQTTEVKRALMLPQEIRGLKFTESLVLITGEKPIKAKKPLYFNENLFINKLKMVSPYLRNIKGIPTQAQFEKSFQDGETKIVINTKEKI